MFVVLANDKGYDGVVVVVAAPEAVDSEDTECCWCCLRKDRWP